MMVRAALFIAVLLGSGLTLGQAPGAPKLASVRAPLAFDAVLANLEKAIEANGMGLVAQASASRGAVARGVKIPGNAVLMVFRNDHAVRMLAASVAAGIEAPLRIYVTENPDRTATISYRRPSDVFAPYRSADLDRLARELDPILDKIVKDAAGG